MLESYESTEKAFNNYIENLKNQLPALLEVELPEQDSETYKKTEFAKHQKIFTGCQLFQ